VIRRLTALWWSLASGPDRLVLRAGLTLRFAAVGLLWFPFPITWSRLRHPELSVLVAVGLTVETVVMIAWWLRRHRLDAWPLALDLPAGAGALLATAALTDPGAGWAGYSLWTGYAYPYTVVIAVTLGFACRALPAALLSGLLWAATELFAAVAVTGDGLAESLFVMAPHLLFATVGWLCAGLLRRGVVQLDVARDHAAAQASELAREQERARHAQALHDRVLQTLEVLARDRVIADPDLYSRVVTEAGWLRRFVENGELDQSADLPAELAAATRVAAGDVRVELNDAPLRTWLAEPLPDRSREALVQATYQALIGLVPGARSAVVRALPDNGGVLVTILTLGPREAPDTADLDRVRAYLAEVGGRFTVEPVPYAELWVPGVPSG
jgi:hypothetical protein